MDLFYNVIERIQLIFADFFLLETFHLETNAATEDEQSETKEIIDPPIQAPITSSPTLATAVPENGQEEPFLDEAVIEKEKTEHFEAFVKPALADFDAESQGSLEHKAIPTERKASEDRGMMLQRQIREDIMDQELSQDHQEDTVMTSEPLLTDKKINFFEDSATGKASSAGSSKLMSKEEAKTVATEFVESLTEEALKVSNEIRYKEQYEAAREVACDFIEDLNVKAAGIVQQMEQQQTPPPRPSRLLSVEISDADLVCDLSEVRQDLPSGAVADCYQDFTEIPSFLSHYVRQFGDNSQHGTGPETQQDEGDQDVTHDDKVEEESMATDAAAGQSQQEPEEDIWAGEAIDVEAAKAMTKTRSEDLSSSIKTKTTSDFDSMTDPYMTADSLTPGKSRPSSSDIDVMLSAVSTADGGRSSTLTTTADYETAQSDLTSYHTAASSFKSTETSEATSGHLASYELSEASETITATLEHDRESIVTPSGVTDDLEDMDGPQLPDQDCRGPPPPSTTVRLHDNGDTSDDEPQGQMVRSLQMEFSNLQQSQDLGASVQTISSNSEVTTIKEDQIVPMVSVPRQSTVDEFDGSKPERELKGFAERSYSIQMETRRESVEQHALSDTEMDAMAPPDPFNRPTTPIPPPRQDTKPSLESGSSADDPAQTSAETTEPAELAFSKHFTQVVEESPMEFEKPIELGAPDVQILTAVEMEDKTKEEWRQVEEQSTEQQWTEEDDEYQYLYNQPLDQIAEEDEETTDLNKLKETLAQTGEFEVVRRNLVIVGKQEGSGDGASVCSLQEFETLEAHVQQMGSGTLSRGSIGSQDSLEASSSNGASAAHAAASNAALRAHIKMRIGAKSSHEDCMSVDSNNSLQEFENMEEACKEVDALEAKAKEQEEVLSEIEEGHESQISESASDTCETLSEGGQGEDDEDPEEFEARLFQIDEIIKQAQTNVEAFDQSVVMSLSSHSVPLEDILGKQQQPAGGAISSESEDSLELLPSGGAPGEVPALMQASIDSLEMKQAVMQLSTDSIDNKIMTISTDSIEGGAKRPVVAAEDMMAQSVDSLEGDRRATVATAAMDKSTDSLESADQVLGRAKKMLLLEGARATDHLMTDSIEKMDSSCEESFMEIGVDGTPRKVVVKHVVDPETSVASVVAERRTQQGLGNIPQDMFKKDA